MKNKAAAGKSGASNDSDKQIQLSMIEYFQSILRTQGMKGLFKGLEVKLWQTVFTAAFMFTIYEKLNSSILALIQMNKKWILMWVFASEGANYLDSFSICKFF